MHSYLLSVDLTRIRAIVPLIRDQRDAELCLDGGAEAALAGAGPSHPADAEPAHPRARLERAAEAAPR